MRHILILNEGKEAGAPIWRFAGSRGEALYVYARWNPVGAEDKALIELLRRGQSIDLAAFHRACASGMSALSPPSDVWSRTIWKPWAFIDFRGYIQDAYGVYLPCLANDFTAICRSYGGLLKLVTPCELSREHASTFSLIESKTRPLRFLQKTDLCSELRVPWAYLLSLYHDSSLSLFVATSDSMVAAVAEFTSGVEQCNVLSPKDVAAWEKYDWLRYGQVEEKPQIAVQEREAMREAMETIREWVERHNERVDQCQH